MADHKAEAPAALAVAAAVEEVDRAAIAADRVVVVADTIVFILHQQITQKQVPNLSKGLENFSIHAATKCIMCMRQEILRQ